MNTPAPQSLLAMSFPVGDWQFWVVTAAVAVVVWFAVRAAARSFSSKRPPRRVNLTINREPKK